MTGQQADKNSGPTATPSLLRRAMAMEAGVWRSLYYWARRRPVGVGPRDSTFAYASAAAPILWVFVGISAFEIPLLHLVLPWPTVRIIFLVLGAWGLIWMVGFLASYYVHPHVVGPGGLRIRNSMTIDIQLPLDAVEQVRPHKRTLGGSETVLYEPGPDDIGIVHIAVSSMTNVEIVLHRPIPVTVPKLGERAVTVVRCYADDPKAIIAGIRDRLAAAETAT